MNRKPAASANRTPAAPGHRPGQRLAAARFKATCLELMDRVRETGTEYVVTKHGTPVARLVPYRDEARPTFLGCLQGTVLRYKRPFDPVPGAWNLNRGLVADGDD